MSVTTALSDRGSAPTPRGRKPIYPWADMAPGRSFFVPLKPSDTVRYARMKMARLGRQFCIWHPAFFGRFEASPARRLGVHGILVVCVIPRDAIAPSLKGAA